MRVYQWRKVRKAWRADQGQSQEDTAGCQIEEAGDDICCADVRHPCQEEHHCTWGACKRRRSPEIWANCIEFLILISLPISEKRRTVMQMLFHIPDALATRFKQRVPAGQRSAYVTKLIEQAMPEDEDPLYLLALEVERDATLNAEMREWREGLIADGIRGQEENGGDSDAARCGMVGQF